MPLLSFISRQVTSRAWGRGCGGRVLSMGIQPRGMSLRSSYTGLYPQIEGAGYTSSARAHHGRMPRAFFMSRQVLGRRWSSNPFGKCSYERPTQGTVCGTMHSMCGTDAGCLAMNYQSLTTGNEPHLGLRFWGSGARALCMGTQPRAILHGVVSP